MATQFTHLQCQVALSSPQFLTVYTIIVLLLEMCTQPERKTKTCLSFLQARLENDLPLCVLLLHIGFNSWPWKHKDFHGLWYISFLRPQKIRSKSWLAIANVSVWPFSNHKIIKIIVSKELPPNSREYLSTCGKGFDPTIEQSIMYPKPQISIAKGPSS